MNYSIEKAYLLFDNLYLNEKTVAKINEGWTNKERYDQVYIILSDQEKKDLLSMKLHEVHKKCNYLAGKSMYDTIEEAQEDIEELMS